MGHEAVQAESLQKVAEDGVARSIAQGIQDRTESITAQSAAMASLGPEAVAALPDSSMEQLMTLPGDALVAICTDVGRKVLEAGTKNEKRVRVRTECKPSRQKQIIKSLPAQDPSDLHASCSAFFNFITMCEPDDFTGGLSFSAISQRADCSLDNDAFVKVQFALVNTWMDKVKSMSDSNVDLALGALAMKLWNPELLRPHPTVSCDFMC